MKESQRLEGCVRAISKSDRCGLYWGVYGVWSKITLRALVDLF